MIKFIYDCYDIIHNSTTINSPLPRKMVPNHKTLLPVRLSFEVKITNFTTDFYELKTRIFTNGLKMIEGQDYETSCAPTTDGGSLQYIITIAS